MTSTRSEALRKHRRVRVSAGDAAVAFAFRLIGACSGPEESPSLSLSLSLSLDQAWELSKIRVPRVPRECTDPETAARRYLLLRVSSHSQDDKSPPPAPSQVSPRRRAIEMNRARAGTYVEQRCANDSRSSALIGSAYW